MRGKWQRRNVFRAHWSLGKKRGGVGCSNSARSVSDGEGHHCFRKHGFKFPNPEHYSADCEKVAAVLFSCLPHLSCLCWSGCAMLDLSHLWIVLYALRSPTSLLVMHGALLNARRCVSLSGSSLLGDYASVVGHHHFKSILSGWVEGKLLFHRLWLASAGQWKMASRAPPTRFQHCSGNEIVCV